MKRALVDCLGMQMSGSLVDTDVEIPAKYIDHKTEADIFSHRIGLHLRTKSFKRITVHIE